MKKILIHFLFLIIIVGDLVGVFLQIKWMEYSFKPMILIWITLYFLLNSKNIDKVVIQLAVAAFVFSWLGDVLLMFSHKTSLFFMSGLLSFFVVQLVYIFLFLRTINLSGKKPFLKKQPVFLIAYIAFGLIIFTVFYPYLDVVLRIALFLYMFVLLGMSSMALNRFGNGHPVSFRFIFIGSLLFILSDTILAINSFVVSIPYEGVFVMLSYISAQYLIMLGVLKQYQTE